MLHGGPSNEAQESTQNGSAVSKVLMQAGYDTVMMDPAKVNILAELNPENDIVFNCVLGSLGESGHLSGMLDYLKVRYTFSGLYASAICMDKVFLKALAAKLGIPVLPDSVDFPARAFPGKIVEKPRRSGGSIDINVVDTMTGEHGMFGEEYAAGVPVTIGLIRRSDDFVPFVPISVDIGQAPIYERSLKYGTVPIPRMVFSGAEAQDIAVYAERITREVGIRGAVRADFVVHDGTPFFLELNTIPGLYPTSGLAYSAARHGLEFPDLVLAILAEARFDAFDNPLLF